MNEYIEQLAGGNPKLQALLEIMKQQADRESQTTDDHILESQLQLEISKRKKLSKHYRQLKGELEEADAFIEELAAALGACPACWGGYEGCPSCSGQGRSGHYRPDQGLFEEYVLPLIKKNHWIKQMIVELKPNER